MFRTSEFKDEKSSASLKLMTFNIACLPLAGAINFSFLMPNKKRVELLIERLKKWHLNSKESPPDIICLQEAMAIKTRNRLKKGLANLYPYHTSHLGQKIRGSGLMIFSKYPMIEMKFTVFNNHKIGDESLATKGILAIKILFSKNYFITIFNTHLEAGGAIVEEKQIEHSGKTISFERGEQMGLIDHQMKIWGIFPPDTHPTLEHIKTFVCGDLNMALNDERRMLSISTGKAKNKFTKGMIKYPGQHELFLHLEHTVPENFFETRDEYHYKNQKKQIVPRLFLQAKIKKKFTGTTLSKEVCENNKEYKHPIKPYDANPKIIDAMFCSQSGVSGEFSSKIISFELSGNTNESDIAISDHFPVVGTWKPNFFKPTVKHDDILIKKPALSCAIL